MGANVSTVQDSRPFVATPSSVAFAPSYFEDYSTTSRNSLQQRQRPSSAGVERPRKAAIGNWIINFHSKASWNGYLEASKAFPNLVVVSFMNTYYEQCRQMEAAFNDFATKYTNVEFVKLDVDELHEISRLYGVRTMPTYLFIKKGKELDRVVGAKKEELQRKIEKHTLVCQFT